MPLQSGDDDEDEDDDDGDDDASEEVRGPAQPPRFRAHKFATSPLLLRSYPCCVSMAQSPSEDSKDSEKKEEDEDEARTPRRPPSCRTATSPPRHRAAPADFALT